MRAALDLFGPLRRRVSFREQCIVIGAAIIILSLGVVWPA